MKAVTVVSLFAAVLSMVSFVPQTWGIIKSRSTDGLSLRMYIITVAGFITWLAYGVLTLQWAIIGQNVICLALSSFILMMLLLSQQHKQKVAAKLDPATDSKVSA